MAENKDVVLMLAEVLASFSELMKKWCIWGLDVKKILHEFHQLRKDDLIGLSRGTHRIEKIHYHFIPYDEKKPEYKVLIDLGEVVVPKNCVDETFMHDFIKKHGTNISVDGKFTDEKIRESCGIELKPGEKFHVYIYELVTENFSVSSDDIRKFLLDNGFVLLESKGIALAYSQKGDLIPKSGDYYFSLGQDCYLPVWLNFQSRKFMMSYQSVDGDHGTGTVFFAFMPIK